MLAKSMSPSKLLQTWSLLLAKDSTKSECSNSQKFALKNSTFSKYAASCSIEQLAQLPVPGTRWEEARGRRQKAGGRRQEAGGRWQVAGGRWQRPKS
jgi:hypothetical protein